MHFYNNALQVESVFSLSVEHLADPANHRHTQFKPIRFYFPVFLGGSRRVWGITGFILDTALKHIIPPELNYQSLSRARWLLWFASHAHFLFHFYHCVNLTSEQYYLLCYLLAIITVVAHSLEGVLLCTLAVKSQIAVKHNNYYTATTQSCLCKKTNIVMLWLCSYASLGSITNSPCFYSRCILIVKL